MQVPTQERIRTAAGQLFRDRGYGRVTVRAVADAARVSPALVMKLFGSKAELYAAATRTVSAAPAPDVGRERLGAHLVQQVAHRLRDSESDPWAQGVFLSWQSPDVTVERRSFAATVHQIMGVHLGEETGISQRVDTATCLLVGLALGLRTLGLREGASPKDQRDFLDRYAVLVQEALDGTP